MRIVRRVALVVCAISLVLAAWSLTQPTKMTFGGGETRIIDCGSPAAPKDLIQFDSDDYVVNARDAANCAGAPSAEFGLYAVGLALLSLAVVAIASWSAPATPARERESAGG